jgi:serine protease Do
MTRFGFAVEVAALAAGLTLAAPGFAFEPDPQPGPADEKPRIVMMEKQSGSYLGIGVAEITTGRAKTLNLGEERGVEITRVEEGSPAEQGGLKTADVVLEYNGERIEGVEQFMRLVRETPPGRQVKLLLSRSGASQTAVVKTGARKSWPSNVQAFEFPRTFHFPEVQMPDVPRSNVTWRSTTLGIEAESLDSQLATFFGVKEGVLVRSVIKGSAAERAGLRAGDVITKVDDTVVSTPREVTSATRAAGSKRTVTLTLVREKREMSMTVALDTPASR